MARIPSSTQPPAIYLDHSSTTPLLPEVAEAMLECQSLAFGNPSSQHAAGRQARRRLEDAREGIAEILGARLGGNTGDRVIFTSGGTEANNLAMLGLTETFTGGEVVISAVEHPSVVRAAQRRASRGLALRRLPVDDQGRAALAALPEIIGPSTRLAAIMLGNNETGVLQPIEEIAEYCRTHGIPVHCDAVQAVGKVPVCFRELGVTTLSAAAHKFHGPRGIGLLIIRGDARISPQLYGGLQEEGLRAGTEPVALVVGMQRALELWRAQAEQRQGRLESLRNRFERRLSAALPEIFIHGAAAPRLPHLTSIAFPGAEGQALVMALDLAGVQCSTGSACASGSPEPSPTLLAMGLSDEVVRSSLRFSLGATTTESELDEAASRIVKIYKDLESRRRR